MERLPWKAALGGWHHFHIHHLAALSALVTSGSAFHHLGVVAHHFASFGAFFAHLGAQHTGAGHELGTADRHVHAHHAHLGAIAHHAHHGCVHVLATFGHAVSHGFHASFLALHQSLHTGLHGRRHGLGHHHHHMRFLNFLLNR